MSMSKERKFLFDTNNFDQPDQPDVEEVYIEPPPIFSLDELGFARDEAFEKGRLAGLQEAKSLREQYIAELVDKISQELKFLSGAENYRAAIYEREVLSLTETIFRALFPYFTQNHGTAEITSVISNVLVNHTEQSSITIEIPEDDLEEIENHFKQRSDLDTSKIIFKPSPQLGRGSCRLSWKDGGALRDHNIVTDEVLKQLGLFITPAVQQTSPPPLANADQTGETEPDSQGE